MITPFRAASRCRPLAASLLLLLTCSSAWGAAPKPLDRVEHLIVIYQENWSFDGLFGKFPGANGLANANKISVGQKLRIPAGGKAADGSIVGGAPAAAGAPDATPAAASSTAKP